MKAPEWYAVKIPENKDMTDAFDAGLRFSDRMLQSVRFRKIQEDKKWDDRAGYFRTLIDDELVIMGYSSSAEVYGPEHPDGWPSIFLSYKKFVDLISIGNKSFLADDLSSLL